MFKNSKKTILNAGRALGISLLLLWSALLLAQNPSKQIKLDSISKKNSLQFGLGVGYGITKLQTDNPYNRSLLRPAFSVMMRHQFAVKNQLVYKISYRSFGFGYLLQKDVLVDYQQLDFAGLSVNYLRTITTKSPLSIGAGIFGERLLRGRFVTIYSDGRRFSNSAMMGLNTINWGGHLMGQYQVKLAKRLTTTIELEYVLGISNLYNQFATQSNGHGLYSRGVFLNLGVFF